MEEDCREEAVIAAPGTETFREFVLFAHNGIRLLDKDGNLIKTTEQGMEPGEEGGHEAPDHEDTGEKGYNYRSERFFNRLQRVPPSTRCSTPTSMATRPRRCFRPYFQLERVRKHRTRAAYLVSFGQWRRSGIVAGSGLGYCESRKAMV